MLVKGYREIAAQTGSSADDSKLFSIAVTPDGPLCLLSASVGTLKATAVMSS